MKTLLIAGTHAWRNDNRVDWYCPTSDFERFLTSQGVTPLFAPGPRPFIWSTDLGGVGFGKGDLTVWAAAGISLYQFVVPPLCPERRVPSSELSVIAHSHGLQVVLYACAFGLMIDTLISVGSPIRKDMSAVAAQARPNIKRWIHLYSDRTDHWQVIGALFDGHFGMQRKHPLADQNDFVRKVGHADLLRESEQFHHWTDRGWLDRLNGKNHG